MPDTLATEDITGVEILRAGRFYGGGSPVGGDLITTADLDEMVRSYEALRDEVRPVLAVGHSARQRIAEGLEPLPPGEAAFWADSGAPAVGWVENLRRQGDRVVADIRRVPRSLKRLIDAGALRARSPEFKLRWQAPDGREHRMVLNRVSLLGARLPAVSGLGDMVRLYEDAGLDPLTDGSATALLPDDPTGNDEGDTIMPLPKDVLDALGLPADATEAQATERASALKARGDALTGLARKYELGDDATPEQILDAATADPGTEDDDKTDGDKADETDGEREYAAAGDVAALAARLDKLAEENKALRADKDELAKTVAAGERRYMESERDRVLDEAIDGKRITPGARDQWARAYEADADGTVALLGTLPENPLLAGPIGHTSRELTDADRHYEDELGALLGLSTPKEA